MKLFFLNMRQAVRNLTKNGWQTFFSVVGLVMGIVCLSFSFNWLWNETHRDSFRRGYKDVYFVNAYFYEDSLSAVARKPNYVFEQVSVPMYDEVVKNLPEGSAYSLRADASGNTLTDSAGNNLYYEELVAVDTGYVALADLRSIVGDAVRALSKPNALVLTRHRAEALFGSVEEAFGKVVYINNGWRVANGALTVEAVVEDDGPLTNLKNDILVGIHHAVSDYDKSTWGNFNYRMLVSSPDREALDAAMTKVKRPDAGLGFESVAVPLRIAHLMDETGGYWNKLIYPVAFVGISVLLLLSAFFNYVSILTTVQLGRIREYALRISMGASFKRNASWMACDMLLIFLLCFLFSGVVMEWVNYFSDMPEASMGSFQTLALVMLAFVVLMLLGFLYPLARMHRIYKDRYAGKVPHRGITASLLFVQLFVCPLMLFILATGYRQMHGIFTADLGYSTENILRINTRSLDSRLNGLRSHFFDIEERLNNGSSPAIVKAVAMHSDLFENVGASWRNASQYGITEEPYANRSVRILTLPYAAFELFDMEMDEGSWFSLPMNPEVVQPAILNPEAREALHLQDYATRKLYDPQTQFVDALGAFSTVNVPMPIIGVMSFRTHTLHEVQEPLLIFCSPDGRNNHGPQQNAVAIYVRHKPGMEAEARAAICKVLDDFEIPSDLAQIERASDRINSFYEQEQNYLRVFTAIAVGSFFITIFGVLSMILYILRLQRRSIAIRRVFGATFADLCRSYLRSYVVLTVLGCVMAIPIGYYVMGLWLELYDVRITIGWLQPLLIFLLLLALVTSIVVLQVRRVMREDLARAMHVE